MQIPSTKESQAVQAKQPTVTISIDKNAQYYINKKKSSADALEADLLQIMKSGNESQNVVLVVDQSVATQETIHALSIVKKHKWKVALATQQK